MTALPAHAEGFVVRASWYECCNRHTADGTRFSPDDPTIAASLTIPRGTHVTLTNPANGRKLKVVIRDAGPYQPGRDIDLTRAGAKHLGYLREGLAELIAEVHPETDSNL